MPTANAGGDVSLHAVYDQLNRWAASHDRGRTPAECLGLVQDMLAERGWDDVLDMEEQAELAECLWDGRKIGASASAEAATVIRPQSRGVLARAWRALAGPRPAGVSPPGRRLAWAAPLLAIALVLGVVAVVHQRRPARAQPQIQQAVPHAEPGQAAGEQTPAEGVEPVDEGGR